MSRILLKITVLPICCILTSCLGGVFYIDLGKDYAWVECNRTIIKIKEETKNSLYGDILIWPQVLNYDYDDKYIIVYQVYDGSEFYDVSSKQDKKEKDSLLNQFSKLEEMKNCYWIIDKETNLVMGPMTKSDFDRKCKELHVKAKMRRFHEKEFWDQSGTLKGIKAGL